MVPIRNHVSSFSTVAIMRFCESSQRLFLAAVLGALVSVSTVGWCQDFGDSLGADADSSEAMTPSIAEDDIDADEADSPTESTQATDSTESDEVVPWIAEEDPDDPDLDNSTTDDGETGESQTFTPMAKTAKQDMQDLAKEHWPIVAGVLGALFLIPVLLIVLRRRRDPVAKYAASSMKAPAEHTPMAIDGSHAFTEQGTLSPIHGQSDADVVSTLQGYGGSQVPPGAPGYPSIPATTPPPIQAASAETSETEFEITEDDVEWDNIQEWADVDSPDNDIAGFEAANANDPFPTFEPSELSYKAPITPIEEPAIDSDEVSITGETAVVSGTDSIGMPSALEPISEGADVSIAEMRLIAIQEALIKEQQRVADLQQRENQLKDQLARMETRLAASNRDATVLGANTNPLSTAETDSLVRLQEENQNLQLQLQSESTQRQAQQLQLQTFETTIKSLEARLKLANTERDNLAKMLYDARRASPRPR